MKKILLTLVAVLLSAQGFAQLYDAVVAKDGSGDFTCIQEAINSIRDYDPLGRKRILVKRGTYEEKIIVPSNKTNVSLIGEDMNETVLVWHDHANIATTTGFGIEPHAEGSKTGRKIGTFQSYTLRVDGPGFECENMTIVNDAMTHYNPNWRIDRKNDAGVAQAVTVHVEADKTVFRNCKILGFQDTVFNGNGDSRQMFYNCYIEGTVDFLFGPATVWLEQCHIHALSDGYYTAASTPAEHSVGYVFNKCKFSAAPNVKKVWLGRPWRDYAAVLLKECELPAVVPAEGWHNWNDPLREKTARYYEYKSKGDGANASGRVKWSRQLDATNAAHLTLKRVFQRKGDAWATNAMPTSFQRLHFAFCDEYRGKGTAYKAGTLEPAQIPAQPATAVEDLVMKLDAVDCTTLVEYVSAAILGRVDDPTNPNDSIMRRFVQGLRYRDGKRGNYASRKHYFTDWIRDNVKQGSMVDLTETFEGYVSKKKQINWMSTHVKDYPQLKASPELLAEIKQVEDELSQTEMTYVPCNKIIKNFDKLQEGDIIAFMTSQAGLDVQHVGFVWRPDPDAPPQLFHASSTNSRVVIANATIADYAYELRNCIGIKVVRLNAK